MTVCSFSQHTSSSPGLSRDGEEDAGLVEQRFHVASQESYFQKNAVGLQSFNQCPQANMFPGWSIWCVLLTLQVSACGLEISGYDNEVICSQGLSQCVVRDEMPLTLEDRDAADVKNLTPHLKLCCKDGVLCSLCLVIETEINIDLDKDNEGEGHSGLDEEDYSQEMSSTKASVTVCFCTAPTMPMCKKVEFTVNHTALTQQNQAKLSIVIIKPAGVSFSSRVIIYSSKPPSLRREVVVPSLDKVCSQELQDRVEECHVPRLSSKINYKMNLVELHSTNSNKSLPSVCVQYENNGRCQTWRKTTIPLYSVTPCMCFQAWDDEDQRWRRSASCPFMNSDFFLRNVWQNVSVSLGQGQMNHRSMLWWNVSAPCRLEGEVWPCHKDTSCREMKGFRQQLTNGTWRQNSKGLWDKIGVFEDINLKLLPCVMLKVKEMGNVLGPFCFDNTDRWRWSLLVIGAMLLVCLSVLLFYFLHDFVKKWVWSWHHGFVQIGRKHHVVLLSPPDVDESVSESVSRLGSLLCTQGFSVSVDLWSRKEQCTMGPLPWLHSQLLELNSQGGRVVLILTSKALDRAEEWTHWVKEAACTNEEDRVLPQMCSPYSDLFMASLCLIQADKQLGRERFVLVKFDSSPRIDRTLPEPLQGLLLFKLPSQTQDLLAELSVRGAGRGLSKRTWTGWRWSSPDGCRAKTKEEPDLQRTLHCTYVGIETKPLEHL